MLDVRLATRKLCGNGVRGNELVHRKRMLINTTVHELCTNPMFSDHSG